MGEPLLSPEAFGFNQSFSVNIKDFLASSGVAVPLPNLPHIECWFIPLNDGAHLHVYAEQINTQNASCDQCRIIGTFQPSYLPHSPSIISMS